VAQYRGRTPPPALMTSTIQVTPEPGGKSDSYASLPLITGPRVSAELPPEARGAAYVYKGASVYSGVLNLANTVLGAGMLSVPYGLSQLGAVLGCLMIVLFGILSFCSLLLLTRLGDWLAQLQAAEGVAPINHPRTSFHAVAKKLAPWSERLIALAIGIKLVGVMVSYLIIASDLATDLFGWLWPTAPEVLQLPQTHLLIVIACVTPVCWLRTLNAQRYSSMLVLTSVAAITGVILTYPLWGPAVPHRRIALFRVNTRIFSVLPLFIFAFTCHQNVYIDYPPPFPFVIIFFASPHTHTSSPKPLL